MPTSYVFIFGRTPDLALTELHTVYPDFQTTVLHPRVVKVDTRDVLVPGDCILTLGGTIKIGTIIDSVPSITAETLAETLMQGTLNQSMVFGVSSFTDLIRITRQLLSEIKNILEASGSHVRFIEPKEGNELTSVVVEKQHVTELLIAQADKRYVVALTDVVQDFEAWNTRDYGRPYADPRSGMLPPKVARMAVNLAMRAIPALEPGYTLKPTLLDPFCGMGTILGEALLRGWRIIGSDQSKDAIQKAEKNIDWLKTVYKEISHIPCKYITEEATHIGKHLKPESVDAIVTEPFMGSQDQRLGAEKVKNIIKGLEKLYIGCFKEWYSILKPNGVIVIALPEYVNKGNVFSVKKVVDNCENLGYTRLIEPITYSRTHAVVRRNFYVFRKLVT